MRRVLAAAVVALVLGSLAPRAASALASSPAPARLAPDLATTLATADDDARLLVFVHGATRRDALRGIDAAGLTPVGEFRSIGVPVAIGTPAEIRRLASQVGITFIEENRPIELALDTARTATRAAEAAADPVLSEYDGSGQTIAVVDGGVDGTHPMFADPAGGSRVVRNLKVACLDNVPPVTLEALVGFDPATCPGAYVTDEDGRRSLDEPFLVDMTAVNDTDTVSIGGHGTHVAGIAAGGPVVTADGRALQGLAPKAKIVAISMGQGIGIYAANAALDWIVRHHDDPCGDGSCPPITVVNNSYGNGGEWNPESATSKIQQALIDRGVVMVWANGNGDLTGDGGDGSDNRSGEDAQAAIPGVISVANYDDGGTGTRDGTLARSSSRGQQGRPATYPDLSAPGTNILSACRPYLAICTSGEADPNYGSISGTSMASPHVAGAVALVRQANPTLTPAQVEALLELTAHEFDFGAEYENDPTNPDSQTSFDKGHGLLDVTKALQVASGLTPTDPPPSPGGTGCEPGAPLVSDPADDATMYALVDTGSNEPALDVLSVSAAGDPVAGELVVTLSVAALGEDAPAGTTGVSFEGVLGIGADSYELTASRSVIGESLTFAGTDVEGGFDPATSTVAWRVPRELLGDNVGTIEVGSLTDGRSRRSYSPTPLGPVADEFGGACATTVDVGGSAEDEPVEGVAAPGAPYVVSGSPTTAAGDPTGLDIFSVTVTGEHTRIHRVQVDAPSGSTLTVELTCEPAGPNDFDIRLSGPSAGSSANVGCDESIVAEDAPAGVYELEVEAFFTAQSTYTATFTVTAP